MRSAGARYPIAATALLALNLLVAGCKSKSEQAAPPAAKALVCQRSADCPKGAGVCRSGACTSVPCSGPFGCKAGETCTTDLQCAVVPDAVPSGMLGSGAGAGTGVASSGQHIHVTLTAPGRGAAEPAPGSAKPAPGVAPSPHPAAPATK